MMQWNARHHADPRGRAVRAFMSVLAAGARQCANGVAGQRRRHIRVLNKRDTGLYAAQAARHCSRPGGGSGTSGARRLGAARGHTQDFPAIGLECP